jgi:hypothetical protein
MTFMRAPLCDAALRTELRQKPLDSLRLASSPGPYDATAPVENLRRLLDSLGIQRMSVLAMGGNEIASPYS